MAQFAPTLSKGEAETLVRGWIDGCLWRREAHRAETNGFDLLETDEIARMPEQDAREIDCLLRLCGVVHAKGFSRGAHHLTASPT